MNIDQRPILAEGEETLTLRQKDPMYIVLYNNRQRQTLNRTFQLGQGDVYS